MANATNSPITGIIEETEVILDFGRFEGKTVEQVARLAQASQGQDLQVVLESVSPDGSLKTP